MNNLKIYRASAGSGKTFQLSKEYIDLLFENPQSYKNILAVTFTNKATEEMKGRILKELFALAQGNESPYLEDIMKKHSMHEMEVRNTAHSILNSILHDYSRFTITTIDRFFQQVIRSLVRELGLYGSYQIELDSEIVLHEALVGMMEELDKPNSDQLREWLIRFSENKIEGQQNWNLERDILNLGKEIFKENYRTIDADAKERFTDKHFLKQYQHTLREYIKAFEESLQIIGQHALDEMQRWGLQREDFSGASRSAVGIFNLWANKAVKAPTKTQLDWQNSVEKWYAKKASSTIVNTIEQAFPVLNKCLVEGIEIYQRNHVVYNSIGAALKNFYTLGLLSDLAYHAQAYGRDNNMMLLSDSSQLLRGIINDSDIPFVYEKVGSYIHHFMIDEFQDTSGMQWLNFEPLLRNSLSSGDRSLIVGDVKQSIYRWRNSDWSLLSEQVEQTFIQHAEVHNLAYNWRSSQQVVDFNNAFFEIAAQALQLTLNTSVDESTGLGELDEGFKQKITNAYKGQYQRLPQKKINGKGYVRFEEVRVPEKAKKEEMQLLIAEKIPEVIADLVARKYELRDIALLVRTKAEGQLIANTLLLHGVPFVSDDVLKVGSSMLVQFLVSLLRALNAPEDLENAILLASLYLNLVKGYSANEAMVRIANESEDYLKDFAFLSATEIDALHQIQLASLYEVVAEVVALFHLQKLQHEEVFLQAFLDIIWDYSTGRSRSISSFLEWWNERGSSKSLPGGEIPNAVRILTIHKSKGMEYKAVLVPFLTWELENTRPNTLWCSPNQAPLNALPFLPISSNKDLVNTIFAADYYREKIQSFVDNLNLAYVAFTRAVDELWGFFHLEGKGEISHISNLLLHAFKEGEAYIHIEKDLPYCKLSEHWNAEHLVFELGTKGFAEHSEGANAEVADIESSEMRFEFPHNRLELFFRSSDFFSQNEEINTGNLMHQVFCDIQQANQIASAVNRTVTEGQLTEDAAADLLKKIEGMFEKPMVKDWFSPNYEVLNERAILLPDGSTLRPDRVIIKERSAIVIDYKFGMHQKANYLKQVKTYMRQLELMGYTPKGYLWYFELNEIVAV